MPLLRLAAGSLWIALSVAACGSSERTQSQESQTGGSDTGKGGASGTTAKPTGGATTVTRVDSIGGSNSVGGTATSTRTTMLAGGTPGSGGQQSGGGTQVATGGVSPATTVASGGATNSAGGSTSTKTTNLTGGTPSSGGQPSGGATVTTKGGTSGTATSDSAAGKPGQGGAPSSATSKQGERFPFPQNVKYPYGVQSTKVTNEFVRSWYENWKKTRLVECSGNLMPAADSSSISKVEAQGFAMVAVAYMGDKDVFDKLYNFYKSKTSSAGCGLSGWQTNCGGVQDAGAATDGDIDVASGLVVAHWQWPSAGYDAKAKSLLTNLRKVILDCSGKWTVYPGCSGGNPWGGCNETDISYYSPAFFRYFAKISSDTAWAKLADDTQKIRDAAANATTGLVPDWQSVSGTAGSGSRAGNYGFDAIRAPYKQCLDYLWNGTPEALTWCKKISSWAYGIGVDKIKDGYQLNGSASSNNHNLAAVGSLAVASMANTQEIADAFATESAKLRDDYWYSSYLGNLYLLAMSGNMWNPDILGVE
ncbi:MAG TPA: glycosyl hydrolase family 8 [Polyangiaceae bacterium]